MKEDILPLNFLRFFAACMVVATHTYSSLVSAGYVSENFKFINEFTKYGYLGVNLFFIISGFVIALSVEGKSLGSFISARFIRLYPVFWLCVTITTLFSILLGSDDIKSVSLFTYLANLTMFPDLYGNYYFIDGVYWTLATEMKFYLVVASVFLLRIFFPFDLQKLAWVSSPFLVYEAFFYNPYSSDAVNVFVGSVFRFYSEGYAPYFLAGILFYSIYKNSKSYINYFALAVCYIVSSCEILDKLDYFKYGSPTSLNPAVVSLYLNIFFLVFLAVSLRVINNESFSFFGVNYRRNLMYLGALTYPLYLLHSRVSYVLIQYLNKQNVPFILVILILICVIGSLVIFVNGFDSRVRIFWKNSLLLKNVFQKMTPAIVKKVLSTR